MWEPGDRSQPPREQSRRIPESKWEQKEDSGKQISAWSNGTAGGKHKNKLKI